MVFCFVMHIIRVKSYLLGLYMTCFPLHPITLVPGLKLNNIQHSFEHRKPRKPKEGFGKKVSCYNIKFKVQLFVLGSKINR